MLLILACIVGRIWSQKLLQCFFCFLIPEVLGHAHAQDFVLLQTGNRCSKVCAVLRLETVLELERSLFIWCLILGFHTRSVVLYLLASKTDRKHWFPLSPLQQYKEVVIQKCPFLVLFGACFKLLIVFQIKGPWFFFFVAVTLKMPLKGGLKLKIRVGAFFCGSLIHREYLQVRRSEI